MDERLSNPSWIKMGHGDVARFSLRRLAIRGYDLLLKNNNLHCRQSSSAIERFRSASPDIRWRSILIAASNEYSPPIIMKIPTISGRESFAALPSM